MNGLSVVVLTKNEELRIASCLDSVKWADELIIVDDESADRTVEIARRYTDRIFIKKMDIEGKQRNWAYALAQNTWVLSLDADERVTEELKEEIEEAISKETIYNGFTIPRRNFIGNYWVRYGGWYPSPQLKLFRQDKFRYEEAAVHPRAFMDNPCGHLRHDLIHYSYKNLEDFLRKLNNQTTREARKWFDQNKPMRLSRFIYRSMDRFIRTYIGRKGYKDGFIGFVVAFNAGLYQFISYLKYREIELDSVSTALSTSTRSILSERSSIALTTVPSESRGTKRVGGE
jgi:glycosyltransferase involved in cell wall biosynthesis